jgi:hypothetical protein
MGCWFLPEEPAIPQPRFVNMPSGLAACDRAWDFESYSELFGAAAGAWAADAAGVGAGAGEPAGEARS